MAFARRMCENGRKSETQPISPEPEINGERHSGPTVATTSGAFCLLLALLLAISAYGAWVRGVFPKPQSAASEPLSGQSLSLANREAVRVVLAADTKQGHKARPCDAPDMAGGGDGPRLPEPAFAGPARPLLGHQAFSAASVGFQPRGPPVPAA